MHEFWRMCSDMMMGSGGVLMMGAMVLFWLAILVFVVLSIRWLWRRLANRPGT